jgi:ABC-type branched-subunit amino acid transport system substrate-binding protein
LRKTEEHQVAATTIKTLPMRNLLGAGWLAVAALSAMLIGDATAAETTIKLGNTAPSSGPASAYGTIARAEAAYFQMLNDQGGINGRKVEFRAVYFEDQAGRQDRGHHAQ